MPTVHPLQWRCVLYRGTDQRLYTWHTSEWGRTHEHHSSPLHFHPDSKWKQKIAWLSKDKTYTTAIFHSYTCIFTVYLCLESCFILFCSFPPLPLCKGKLYFHPVWTCLYWPGATFLLQKQIHGCCLKGFLWSTCRAFSFGQRPLSLPHGYRALYPVSLSTYRTGLLIFPDPIFVLSSSAWNFTASVTLWWNSVEAALCQR